MIEYIYFVKCPNCDDEHFDIFDDAKAFACGRLSEKPVITQVEINRNDFGECTDSNDLGTVWSWEDMMKDIPEETTFSKADTLADDVDYFNEFDDVLDDVTDRKPIPADMTIEDLVEEMERNENDIECKVCEGLFDRQTMHHQDGVGYICEACFSGSGHDLTEALKNYPFEHLRGEHLIEMGTDSIKIKRQILDALQSVFPRPDYFDFGRGFTTEVWAPYTRYGYGAYILDFHLTDNGHILVKYRHNRTNEILFDDLEEMFDGLATASMGNKVLRAIYNAANKFNSQYRPGLTQRRDTQVADWLTQMQDKVDLFKLHITNITYEIPQSYDAADIDKTGNQVSEEALSKMDKIYNDFINNDLTPDLARAAIDAGMVVDRPTSLDTSHNIAHSWHGNARITFDRYVTELDQELQDIIAASKFRQDGDSSEPSTKKTKTVNNYRLANALIKHFGDIKFYEKPTEPAEPELLTASAQQEGNHLDILEEAASYRDRLILCDSCMTPSLDEETGICINCGASVIKEAALTEGYSSLLADEQKSLLESFIDEVTAECEQARTAGQQNVHQVVMPWELRGQACKHCLIESLEKAGFPGGQTVSYDDELVFVPLNDKGQGYGETMECYYTDN